MPKWVGPVMMLKSIGPLTYCLKLPEMNDGELEIVVDRILNHRTRKHGRKQVTEY